MGPIWSTRIPGVAFVPGETPLLAQLAAQLAEYFRGARRMFELPLELPGTDFQRRIWQRLLLIPYGATISYGELAREVGAAAAVRAAGRAVGDNRRRVVQSPRRMA